MTYYVRSGSSSIVAKGEVHDELMAMATHTPYDERPNPKIKIEDISIVLVHDFYVAFQIIG
jgi:ATP-dependent DNA helicase RecG